MKKHVVAVLDTFPQTFCERLTHLGLEVKYCPDVPVSKLDALFSTAYGVVLRSKLRLDAALLAKMPKLRFIARAGAGMEEIDAKQAGNQGVTLLNAPEGNADTVAEHCVGMLLALLNNLAPADHSVRQGKWLRETYRGQELKGKCVGLLGFGHMGQAFAQRLQGFGCEICAHDQHAFKTGGGCVEAVSLEALQRRSDVLSLHIPLSAANRGYVNAHFLAKCKRSLILLNTSRGGILDQEALCEALQSAQVGAAALDVLENEALESLSPAEKGRFDYLCAHKHVLFSPHVAGWSQESYTRIADVLAEKIGLFMEQNSP